MIAHASVVLCNADSLAGIGGENIAETTGADNLKTIELVYKAYESAERGKVIRL